MSADDAKHSSVLAKTSLRAEELDAIKRRAELENRSVSNWLRRAALSGLASSKPARGTEYVVVYPEDSFGRDGIGIGCDSLGSHGIGA